MQGKGHRKYFECTKCDAHPVTEEYLTYSRDFGRDGVCATCRTKYQEIIAVQKKLKEHGYYSGSIDGLFGTNSKKAMNDFRAEVMGKGVIDYFDNETYQKIINYQPHWLETEETKNEQILPDETITVDTNKDIINALDKKEVTSWVNNEDFGEDGYLLLEMTLDDNNNGNVFKAGYTAWEFLPKVRSLVVPDREVLLREEISI